MASTATLLQHRRHKQHPLKPQDFSKDSIPPLCHLCNWKISADGYACLECKFYVHRVCAEAPPRIDPHPLHTNHPLTLIHRQPPFIKYFCDLCFNSHDSLFRCHECDFNLDIRCALSTLSDLGGTQGKTPEQITLPLHIHTLTSFYTRHDFIGDSNCEICKASVEGDGYACLSRPCEFLVHKRCVQDLFGDECDFNLYISCTSSTLLDRGGSEEKTPKWIALPLHLHMLTSFSTRYDFVKASDCVICKESVEGDGYACLHCLCEFLIHKRCIQDLFGDEFDFNLDISCASSSLLEQGGSEGKTPKWIALPLHHHRLTSFSTRYDFIRGTNCVICKASVEGDGDGYACLHWECEFLVHRRCIEDLYYTDGTKAPRIYHSHPLKTFLGEVIGSTICANCGSNESSGEFIGCAECRLFYCRDCVQAPETIQYPNHPDHTLVLFFNSVNNYKERCDSCSYYLEGRLYYGCPSCEFFVDLRCALQVLAYCKEGMSAEIKLSWHEHQLHLCHRTEFDWCHCSYCEDKSAGPMYTCIEKGCEILLHKRCIEIEVPAILQYPHPSDHPLTLCQGDDFPYCVACCETILHLCFSCELCAFYLHAKCAARFPTRKHPLHEHELLQLEKAPLWKCNRCGTRTSSPFFRCVPCRLNLHVKCMELPQVVKNEIHWHPLTLHESYVEDDSGEYYCDKCEKSRDVRLGAYVCLQCSQRWVYHIECVFPELRKVCAKDNTIAIERLTDEISRGEEEVREAERKLNEMKRELEEKRKKRGALVIIE